jgi:Ca2+-binding RTX toxin-like protein
MGRGKRQPILAGALALVAGAGLAVLVAGAGADTPRGGQITIFNEDGVLRIAADDTPQTLTILGKHNRCCMKLEGETITDFSDECEPSASGLKCNVSKLNSVLAEMNGGDDRVTVDDKFNLITIAGSTGADRFLGSKGPDVIKGGEDNDTLKGREGKDRITGGSGEDRCKGSGQAKIKQCEE